MEVAELLDRVRPVALAGQRTLSVADGLRSLLPEGLRRGATVHLPGAPASLLLSLMSEASASGSWCALVGLPEVGGEAAAALGLDLGRLALVPRPGERWATVVAALLDGVDLVGLRVPEGRRARPADARRLAARARGESRVLLVAGPGWPEPADLTLQVVSSRWEGLGPGCGHLLRRRVEVEVTGRRGADRPRRGALWLPGESGRPEPLEPAEPAAGPLPLPEVG